VAHDRNNKKADANGQADWMEFAHRKWKKFSGETMEKGY
jgi:hypothetical protein